LLIVKTIFITGEKRNMMELVSTPQEAVSYISNDVYNIKIKCLACSESKFIPYVPPIVQDGTLIIGEHSFPLKLIEMVTARWKDEYTRGERKYKVDSRYFRQFFNDAAIKELEKFEL